MLVLRDDLWLRINSAVNILVMAVQLRNIRMHQTDGSSGSTVVSSNNWYRSYSALWLCAE
jgi:hypothetical protein